MFNKNYYKTYQNNKHIFLTLILKIVLLVIFLVLLSTSLKTINTINIGKKEYETKEKFLIQSYIKLISTKNEEKLVSSPEFIAKQGGEIHRLVASNETRLQILNSYELEKYYLEYRNEYMKSQQNIEEQNKKKQNALNQWINLLFK